MTREDQVSYAAAYGGFKYQANSWEYPRRVVCKVEKPTDQLIHMFTFIVTNMDASVEDLIRFYCKRGHMENFIKESKNGFDFGVIRKNEKTADRYHTFETAEGRRKSGSFSTAPIFR